ncbi:MAG: hypothetical protein KGJ58_03000 [Patescibacteria group bacterium]|nr:hypothetical protein [Patescibacteria group bacterium]MDE1988359.1 hypothetical protein [Patescibacteria group bacterium]MDE2218393.1 hypothetical protein [Patescibacteria group bacterium]
MINKNFLKFSLGFLAVIAFSFSVLVFIGYYKIENLAMNAASNNKDLKSSPQ